MKISSQKQKFYITTPIFYVNSVPHIGHAFTGVVADVLKRYYALKGKRPFLLTGTDEHGVKIVRAAEVVRKDPQKFTDEISAAFMALMPALNISYDYFLRTTDQKIHWSGVFKMWNAILARGDLYKDTYTGLYCVGHEAFMKKSDLRDGICPDHKTAPEAIEEENYFFRLSKYKNDLIKIYEEGGIKIVPASRTNEVLALLGESEDISFSRPSKDLRWGIPVPGDDTQTIYVWADALTNYLSAIGYGRNEEWQSLWPADLHIIGKDILRFHAIIWPAMLLSAGLSLPKSIFVHGFITIGGEKMSKTVGNVIDPVELVKKYGTDAVRYFLLREISSGEDGDFSIQKFEERYNGDLANGIGNLVARTATLGEKVSPLSLDLAKDIDAAMKKEIDRVFTAYEKYFSEIRLHEALAVLWELIGFSDRYINKKKPWSIADEKELRVVLANASYCIGAIASLLEPFLPETAEKIRAQISVADSVVKIKKGNSLFPRLDK